MNLKNVAPSQEEGSSSNTKSSRKVPGNVAEFVFRKACDRLRDVNQWHELAGIGSAEFQLTDNHGKQVDRSPQVGDHFRISIPGPGNESGEGFDWVKVEDVSENTGEEKLFSMTVRPAPAPGNDSKETAHFFRDDATSTFTVALENNEVSVAVFGRNELPNTSVEKDTNKVRNAAVATGAMTLFSKIQWKKLVNGILDFSI